ncbi:MAG: hypothetical protein DRH24_07420 [Deltaproteobacteria bacterium]|nr:MAG: hypothetical protein DRH24_07420 [Deltaproteobacteria bacterium]
MNESKSFSVYNGLILEILRSFYESTPVLGTIVPLIKESQWGDIFTFLRFHKLLPIAYHVLSGSESWETIPNDFKQSLKQASFENTALILLLRHFMEIVASALEKARIPFYIIKGPAVALEFYRPSDLRPYTDIDIVIPFNSFGDAIAILNDLSFSSRRKSFTKEYFDSVHFSNAQYPGICIDLQWESVTSIWTREPFLSSKEVWDQIRLLKTSESKHIPVLAPMFLIPFLCTHLVFHHPMALLFHLMDLALVVRDNESDLPWDELVRWVQYKKLGKPVYHSLTWTRDTLDVSIPPAVLDALKPGVVERHFFPFRRIASRHGNMPEFLERVIKFPLIEGWKNKTRSITSYCEMFYQATKDE